MIIPDVNLLVYAHNRAARFHQPAREWFEGVMNQHEPVGFSTVAVLGFVRILSNPKIVAEPIRPDKLLALCNTWLILPVARLIGPGSNHFAIMEKLHHDIGAGNRMITDVHLAALAIEHSGTLYSNDLDFGRIPQLQWKNPIR